MTRWPAALATMLLTTGPVALLEVHGPDGQRFFINPAEITSVREPIGKDRQHFAPGMRCVIEMSSGKFLPTHDTCDEVRAAVDKAATPPAR